MIRNHKKIVTYITIVFLFMCTTLFLSLNQERYIPSPFLRVLQEAKEVTYYPTTNQKVPSECGWPKDNIFFLKIHKCGSSTVQNILMRRGLARGLNFVLPAQANYLGHPEPFNAGYHIGLELRVPDRNQQYQVFTHHTRYHSENVRKLMPANTKRITILREPAALLESLYYFYGLQQMMIERYDLVQMLRLPFKDMQARFERMPRLGTRVGYNQMAFDIGMNATDFKDPNSIRNLLEMMERDFHLVMISEHMEASLVLLADLMCWSLEEVAFITLNARPDHVRSPMDASDNKKLNELNNVDKEIYNYFKEQFKYKIQNYGIKKMEDDIGILIQLNQKLMEDCVSLQIQPKFEGKTYPVVMYQLKENGPEYCKYVIMDELKFTEVLRRRQISKFKTIRKLNRFIN